MRLLIAERSTILRRRLTWLFSDMDYISSVAFVEEPSDLQKAEIDNDPDVIVIDIDFPTRLYLKILERLKNEMKQTKVLVITENIEPRYKRQYKKVGVSMVFNKEEGLNKFIKHLNFLESVK